MNCPQCGAEVPSDDTFCGKCGYAMRDHGPERLDQSRIRVHEAPDLAMQEQPSRSSSEPRVRKHTVLGMPSITPPTGKPAAASKPPPPPPPPTSLSSARSARTRTPQKTMLGIPRPELSEPASAALSAESTEADQSMPPAGESSAPPEPAVRSPRARSRVRYDSANEPVSVTQRRQKAFRGLAVLVLLAAAWLGYRFLTVNG
jgi:predicted nucleic acid-binding Zn ribbon protein